MWRVVLKRLPESVHRVLTAILVAAATPKLIKSPFSTAGKPRLRKENGIVYRKEVRFHAP